MSEMTIKNKIAEAMQEPSVPESLVNRTVVRAQALVEGRKAERRLAQESGLSGDEKAQLAAQSLVGRLMMTNVPTEGVSNEMMRDQLLEQKKFQQMLSKPVDQLLSELQSGKMIRALGEQKTSKAEKSAATLERKQPTLKNPMRSKEGPSR